MVMVPSQLITVATPSSQGLPVWPNPSPTPGWQLREARKQFARREFKLAPLTPPENCAGPTFELSRMNKALAAH